MTTRGAVLLAIGMLILGLLIGLLSGGVAGFFFGQTMRPALGRNIVPFVPQPGNPGLPFQPPQSLPPFQNVNGATVTIVEPNSPAEKAGLQVGDVITAVDNAKVDANHSLADLVQAHKPGDKIALAVTRGGQSLTIDVELSGAPQNASTAYLGIRFAPSLPTGGNRRFQGPQDALPN